MSLWESFSGIVRGASSVSASERAARAAEREFSLRRLEQIRGDHYEAVDSLALSAIESISPALACDGGAGVAGIISRFQNERLAKESLFRSAMDRWQEWCDSSPDDISERIPYVGYPR